MHDNCCDSDYRTLVDDLSFIRIGLKILQKIVDRKMVIGLFSGILAALPPYAGCEKVESATAGRA
jgi:hypothetical protein